MATHLVIRENWLTRKLHPRAKFTAILGVLWLAFAAVIYWGNRWNAEEWMPATHDAIFIKHEMWRAWTTLLVHADARHLVANCFLFYIIGLFLCGFFGFFIFPFLAFAMGGVTNLIVLHGMRSDTQLIGVSGVVFWMGGFWLVLYFLFDRRRSMVARALRAGGVSLLLFMPAEAFDPSISYAAHFTGFVIGAASGVIYYRWRRPEFKAAEVTELVSDETPLDSVNGDGHQDHEHGHAPILPR